VLLLGLVGAWAVVFKVKTTSAVIARENRPADTVVERDGGKVTPTPRAGAAVAIETKAAPAVAIDRTRFKNVKVTEPDRRAPPEGRPAIVPPEGRPAISPAKATDLKARVDVPKPPSVGPAGWVSLFNGRDLTGWRRHPQAPGNWRVQNGVLIGSGASFSSLWTARDDYRDFHLRVEARINRGGDSGVFFRWLVARGGGYQAQVVGQVAGHAGGTGSLYSETGTPIVAVREPLVSPGQWFALDVIAYEDDIIIKVNGRTTANYTDLERRFPSGSIGLEQVDPATWIEFRRVEVKELNRGQPMTISATGKPRSKKAGAGRR
jgi:hypothetical protein